jgi:uncharacterized membrane protein
MSALSVHASRGLGSPAPAPRFACAADEADGSIRWHMKRNCSFAPRQLLGVYLSLCASGVGIAELLAVGAAIVIYARHAADNESLVLRPGRFSVACTLGRRVEQADFVAPAWVRVEPAHRDGSLIELSGEGRHIAVGRFVRPELRRALADELRAALRRTTNVATA